MKFKITGKKKTKRVFLIRAKTENPVYRLTAFLDLNTKEPLYPVNIESPLPGVTFTIDSETGASCSLPPIIPGHMIHRFGEQLKQFNDVITAARDWIRQEQQKDDSSEP